METQNVPWVAPQIVLLAHGSWVMGLPGWLAAGGTQLDSSVGATTLYILMRRS
eukprot:COSAG01_NODE_1339_length_10661_cov_49.319068_10_plen_53_part_00